MSEQHQIPTDEERELEEARAAFDPEEAAGVQADKDRLEEVGDEERELNEAEKAFEEQNKIIAAQQSGDEETTFKNVDDTPSTKDILIALGFKRKENGEPNKVQYTLTDGEILIGRTFTEQFKNGKFWAIKNSVFLLEEELKELAIVKKFYAIREGKEELPEKIEEEQQGKGEPTREETAERNMEILASLGFKPYHDAGVTKYNIHVMNTKFGVTFNESNPLGKIWAYKIPENPQEGGEKEFLKNGDLKQHPLIQKYHAIQEGKEPMPEITIEGKIIEKHGKAIKIQITENGETKEIFYGQGAVKKDNDGYFLPAGFSKAGKTKEGVEHDAKMTIPRDIRLPDYLTQLEQAPMADTAKEEHVVYRSGAEAVESQPTEKANKGTVADKIPHKEPLTFAEGEKPTVDYYINLIGEITEKVRGEERISRGEQGYAISKVFDAITRDTRTALIAELKNGGDRKEEA